MLIVLTDVMDGESVMAPLTPQNVRNPMNRIKMTATVIYLLATLFATGCMCMPGYYSGMSRYSYGPQISYGHNYVGCDNACNPCGPEITCDPCGPEIPCAGVVEYGCNPCLPQHGTIVNCRTSFSNISNGVLLVGRGVLDITAKPFIIVGKVLSSGCQYEVIAHCPGVAYVGSVCHTVEACGSVGTSGCDSCDNGYAIDNGRIQNMHQSMQYNNTQSRIALAPPLPQRSSNTVIQAAYVEPTRPVIRFVQPR